MKPDEGTSPGGDALLIQSVMRAFQVLEAFSSAPAPRSLNDLSKMTGLHKSAVQRICRTLSRLGYLEFHYPGGFLPGTKILDRAFDFLRGSEIVRRAIPVLADLRNTVKEGVNLTLFQDTTLVYAVRMQSKREHIQTHLIGRRVPTYCTSGGIAVLSRLPDEIVEDIIIRSELKKITSRTITDPKEIMKMITKARANSYALAVEQIIIGEIALGVAIMDHKGNPLGALHVVGSLGEWTPEAFAQKMAPAAISAARALDH